jgi:hypothetical protein
MLGNYRVAAQLVASRAVLSSTELVLHQHILVSLYDSGSDNAHYGCIINKHKHKYMYIYIY